MRTETKGGRKRPPLDLEIAVRNDVRFGGLSYQQAAEKHGYEAKSTVLRIVQRLEAEHGLEPDQPWPVEEAPLQGGHEPTTQP
jgi:hypothetical protein